MTRRPLTAEFMTANGRHQIPFIMGLVVLVAASWMIGCGADNPIADEIADDAGIAVGAPLGDVATVPSDDKPVSSDEDPGAGSGADRILMHLTGGFAGFSRIISIEEKEGSILLAYVDEGANQRRESNVSREDLDRLWRTLEASDVFALPTNLKMLETVRDAFMFEITVEQGGDQNKFSVYAPDLLGQDGEKRYDEVVRAIQGFADLHLQAVDEFIVSDMPITDVSEQVLESFPYQVHMMVEGYLPDGCTELNQISQRREGNTIRIHITMKRPKDRACTLAIKKVVQRIPLEGGFLPGRYEVIVNDFEMRFEIEDVPANVD